jgi:hypothetical protein
METNQIETRGGLDTDKHIQKVVGESPRVWQKPLLSLGPILPELERSSGMEVALE